jgi:hypothetical protein
MANVAVGRPSDRFEYAIGGYFVLRYPDDWPIAEQYDFDWDALEGNDDPFQNFPYPYAATC